MFDFTKLFDGSGIEKQSEKSIANIDELGRMFRGTGEDIPDKELVNWYQKSLYVYAIVRKIATRVSTIDFHLYEIKNTKGEIEEVYSHELLDLMHKVNPFQTQGEFLKIALINKKLTGEAVWLKIRDNRGTVVELWNLRPDLINVIADPENFIKRYELHKQDGGVEIFDPEDIIHFKEPNPLDSFRGQSPLRATTKRIQTEESATNFQKNFFKNNGRPDAIIYSSEDISTEQKNQIQSTWEQRHTGDARNSRIGVLEGGLKYQQVSLSTREMDYIESMKFTRDDILIAYGVPKSVITTENINYATAEAGMRMFLTEVVVPEMRELTETLNEMLVVSDFNESLFFDFPDPTPDDRQQMREDHREGYAKWLTVNEIRDELNKEPVQGGDEESLEINRQEPSRAVSEASLNKKARKNARKILHSRPYLRKKLEIIETTTKAISELATEDVMKEFSEQKNTKNKKIKKKENQKTKRKEKKLIRLIGDDVQKMYLDLRNKKVDDNTEKFQKKIALEAEEQKDRVLDNLEKIADERESSLKGKKIEKRIRKRDLRRIMDVAYETETFASIGLPFLLEAAEESADEGASMIGETYRLSDRLKVSMEERAEFFANEMSETTFEGLQEALGEGIDEGDGRAGLAERVKRYYAKNVVEDGIPQWRAELIARTESTEAIASGELDFIVSSNRVTHKEWLTAEDDNVRTDPVTHRIHGEIVKKNDTFSNGMMKPGGFNCRCALAPVVEDEAV